MASAFSGGGTQLGGAQGSVTIGHNFRRLEQDSQRAAQNVNRNFRRLDQGAQKTERSFRNMQRGVEQFGSAFGVALGIAGAVQLGRMAIRANETATAFGRQEIAARNLAGGQEELNRLLQRYEEVTGGAVSRSQTMADVTQLLGTGFADSAAELERFAIAARGVSFAQTIPVERVFSELQLAISNISFDRLDQLGTSSEEVRGRMEELQEATSGMSREAAFQEALLEILIEKYGDVITSEESATTGAEKAGVAVSDLSLAFGEATSGATNFTATYLTRFLQDSTKHAGLLRNEFDRLWQSMVPPVMRGRMSGALVPPDEPPGTRPPGAPSRPMIGPSPGPAGRGEEAMDQGLAALRERNRSREDIEAETAQRINEITRDHGQERAQTIADFEQQIARDAADFARQRQRQEEDLARRIADIQEERVRRETQWAEDLAERITGAQTESAERIADWERDRNEAIAEVRTESNERLQDLEEDYAREREQALRDHRNNILSAAGRLDARALLEEQRRFAAQEAAAADSHEERISDEQEAEQERIDEINEKHRERLEQERETLQETIDQAREAHRERLEDAREADRQRIDDMREAFELQKEREDEDRAIRLERQRQDHDDQLQEMDRTHDDRIQQIHDQGDDELEALDEEFNDRLTEIGGFFDEWEEVEKESLDVMRDDLEEFVRERNRLLGFPSLADPTPTEEREEFQRGGPVTRTGLARVHAGEFVLPAGVTSRLRDMLGGISQPGLVGAVAGGGGRSLTIESGAIQVHGAPGQSEEVIGRIVEGRLIDVLERLA